MIKRIGTEARQDLEPFFETKVFLDLRVKVNPDWRDNERTLDEIGVPRTARRPRSKRSAAHPDGSFTAAPRSLRSQLGQSNDFSDRSIAARHPLGSTNASSPLPAAAAADFAGPPNPDPWAARNTSHGSALLDLERAFVVRFDGGILRRC